MSTEEDAKVDLIRLFDETLGPKWREFKGDQANDLARGLIAQQASRWRSVIDNIFGNSDSSNLSRYFVGILRRIVESAGEASISNTGGSIVVESDIPLITRDLTSDIIREAKKYRPLLFALIISKCQRQILLLNWDEAQPLVTGLAFAELEALTSNDGHLRSDEDTNGVREAATQAFDTFLDNAKLQFANLDKQYRNNNTATSALIKQLESILADSQKKDEARGEAWEKERSDSLAGLRREVLEFTRSSHP